MENAIKGYDMNESCGDEITLYVKVEDNKIKNAAFEGQGCVVSMASAAILVKLIRGRSIEEVKNILDNVKKMAKGENFDEDLLGDLVVFSNISDIPQRSKCFLLAWSILERLYDEMAKQGRVREG
ncbi:MAG: SUF system NifU family Fe-S cluster assembly protein [Thermotogaceae bacterium]|nr:SUF system NifU family Fe-S cluster assembly protein [Thermotogaceae bacterium]